MEKVLRILIVDADAIEIKLIGTILKQGFDNIELIDTLMPDQARELITTGQVDLALVDSDSLGNGNVDIFRCLMELQQDIPVILLTDTLAGTDVLNAINVGVQDCVVKSLAHLKELPVRIANLTGFQITEQYRKHLSQDHASKISSGSVASSSRRLSSHVPSQPSLDQLLGGIAVASNNAMSFDHALQICLEKVCEYTGWPLAHAYLVDNTHQSFTLRMYRYPEKSDIDEYISLSDAIHSSSVAGLPGRVMRTRRPSWVSDFSLAEDFVNTDYLMEFGLKAGFAFPIFFREEVVAILEFFCREVTEPDFEFLDVMVPVGIQLTHVYDRERTRQSLQFSEEKFAAAFRSSPDAISIISTTDGMFIDVNERFLQLFSYRRHEVVGKNTRDMVLWQDPGLEQTFINRLRECGMVHDMEADLCLSSGKTINCLLSADLINISRGEHALVLIRDITERVATTAALKRSEGLLRSYFNAGFVGMAIISPENKFIQVNNTGADIFGYPTSRLLGMGINELTVAEDVEESVRLFKSVIAGEVDGYSEEKRCLRKDGNTITISMLIESVRREDGSIDYLVAFFRDITKRVLSQNELKKSEARLRKAQHIAHLGFWEIDLTTDELYLSDEIFSMCGIDRSTFSHNRSIFSQLIHPDDYERASLERENSIDSGLPFNTEYRIIRSDGKIRYIQSQGEVVRNEQNEPIRMVGTLQDITERKLSEVALFKSNRALRVLNECTHTIVHATSGQEMIDAVCRIIIETGGYRFAWVGYAQNDEAKTVYPVAKAGYETGYLANTFSWGGDVKIFDPVSDAIATGKPSLVKNLADIDIYGSIRNAALASGYRSAIALPLNVGDKAFGALMIYAPEPDAFDIEEVMLLTSLADDLAFGILSLHTRAEHERAGGLIKEQDFIFKVLFDENPAMLFTVDEIGTILSVNRAGSELLGYRDGELSGRSIFELSHDAYKQTMKNKIKECLENPGTVIRWEQQKVCRNGTVLWVNGTARVVMDGGGERYIYIVCDDISETRKRSDQLSYQATHDSLTGLINRGEFEDRLNNLLSSVRLENSQHALCYMDLAQFRNINDTCGHIAGDELLRQLAKLLLGQIRKRDTIARFGGDEFVILMEHCPLYRAEDIAKKIMKALENFRFVWDRNSFSLAASIGLVPINNLSGNVAEILNNADQACYTAKDKGLNQLHVFAVDADGMRKKRGEISKVDEIREALVSDGFELYFQSIEPLRKQQDAIERFETLLRMNTEAGEFLNADAFMPVAERYGLSVDIDRWVVNNLFNLITVYRERERSIPQFFVNLSGHSLGNNELLDFIIQGINGLSIPPEKICFEITETVAIANLTSAIRFISVLRETGCYFALDDFGSGLSSYAYLKNLHVDYLKIDGFFIKGITEDPVNLAIVKSMFEIGRALGKQVIAEFVENNRTRETLRQVGIDYVQGNFIARERSFEEISRNPPANIIEFSKRS